VPWLFKNGTVVLGKECVESVQTDSLSELAQINVLEVNAKI
jgi:hypothetical protein